MLPHACQAFFASIAFYGVKVTQEGIIAVSCPLTYSSPLNNLLRHGDSAEVEATVRWASHGLGGQVPHVSACVWVLLPTTNGRGRRCRRVVEALYSCLIKERRTPQW
jgi:hypothetical protein